MTNQSLITRFLDYHWLTRGILFYLQKQITQNEWLCIGVFDYSLIKTIKN